MPATQYHKASSGWLESGGKRPRTARHRSHQPCRYGPNTWSGPTVNIKSTTREQTQNLQHRGTEVSKGATIQQPGTASHQSKRRSSSGIRSKGNNVGRKKLSTRHQLVQHWTSWCKCKAAYTQIQEQSLKHQTFSSPGCEE